MSRNNILMLTSVWLALTVFTFTIMNPPQCPDSYTQAQIDSANCIVGANIGLGIFIMFIFVPLSVILIGLWSIYILRLKQNKQTDKK